MKTVNIPANVAKALNLKPVKVRAVKKSKSASKVLQLMDQDWNYMDAVKKVSKEDGISIKQLEKELNPFI